MDGQLLVASEILPNYDISEIVGESGEPKKSNPLVVNSDGVGALMEETPDMDGERLAECEEAIHQSITKGVHMSGYGGKFSPLVNLSIAIRTLLLEHLGGRPQYVSPRKKVWQVKGLVEQHFGVGSGALKEEGSLVDTTTMHVAVDGDMLEILNASFRGEGTSVDHLELRGSERIELVTPRWKEPIARDLTN